MPKKKIVHLSSVHQADDVRIFHKECRSLTKAGYDVTLIANAENDQCADGVRIKALRRRSGNRLARMTLTTFDVLGKALRERGDAYHFHDPELIPVGVVLKLLGKPVVYDVHEDLPKQIASKGWIPRRVQPAVSVAAKGVQRFGGWYATGIVAATPAIGATFPEGKTIIVQNLARMEEFVGSSSDDYQTRPNNVAYVGGITKVRAIMEMIRAMEYVGHAQETRLLLGGSFSSPSLEEDARREPGWKHVDFNGWLGREEVVGVYDRSRVGLLLFHAEPNHLDAVPNKLFEYMAAGLPVVASNFPHWKQFIEDIGSGVMVDPKDPRAIAAAVRWLLENPVEAAEMGRRGREAVLTRYTWDREAAKLEDFYRACVLG